MKMILNLGYKSRIQNLYPRYSTVPSSNERKKRFRLQKPNNLDSDAVLMTEKVREIKIKTLDRRE